MGAIFLPKLWVICAADGALVRHAVTFSSCTAGTTKSTSEPDEESDDGERTSHISRAYGESQRGCQC